MLLNCGVGEDSCDPLDCKESQPVHPKGDQSWVFIERTDAEAETPIFWPPDAKLLLLLLSHFSCVQLCATPQMAAHQAPCPWDCPAKNTGVGCHFLLQCMKVKCESEVAQSCPTLSDPMDCSLPGSSVHGIFQARVLEWGAIAFSNSSHEVAKVLEFQLQHHSFQLTPRTDLL